MLTNKVNFVRQVPQTADFGAYLAGILARNNQDIEEAADYYEMAYLGDPKNGELVRETYLLSGLAGHFDIFMQTAEKLVDTPNSYYAPLFLAARSVKQENYENALKISPIFNSPDKSVIHCSL